MKVEIKDIKLWNASKAALERKFTALKVYSTYEESSQINKLSSYLKKIEKEEQSKHKASNKEKIIKITVEINEIENQKQQEKKHQ